MTYLIIGENTYQQKLQLDKIISSSKLSPEFVDDDKVTLGLLADILRGGSLFSDKRLVVFRGLSKNLTMFNKLTEWLPETTADTTVVIVEKTLDKRTKSYKSLVKIANVLMADYLSERDRHQAQTWLRHESDSRHISLSSQQVSDILNRSLISDPHSSNRVFDQMLIINALNTLSGTQTVDEDMLSAVLPLAINDGVFDLLSIAIHRQSARADKLVNDLSRDQDGYMVLSLLISQWSQLVMVGVSDGTLDPKQLGIHPYAYQKTRELTGLITKRELKDITDNVSLIDTLSKSTTLDPWDGVYRIIQAIILR